jgi:LPPG:FO 2-phospho-L-lactate transferase
MEAIVSANAVLIAPSNPVTSIGPILAVPGIRDALQRTPAPVVAVSPIVGTAAVSGPAGDLMRAQGLGSSIAGVAKAYGDFINLLVVHESDAELAKTVKVGEVEIHCADILMRTIEDRTRVASTALSLACPELIEEQAAG